MNDPLHLEGQLCFALYNTSRAMTGAYQPLLEKLELTYPQYLVMLALWEKDGARVSRMGERLCLDSATLTPLLKRLEARGLLTRQRSQADERVVQIHLSAEGKRLKKKAEGVPKAIFAKTGMSLAQLNALRDQLVALTERLRAPEDP